MQALPSVIVALATLFAAASSSTIGAQRGAVPRIAVQALPPDAPLTRGLAVEVTHRLESSPDIIVLAKGEGSDFVVRLTSEARNQQFRVTWELTRIRDSVSLAADTSNVNASALAELPSQIGSAVLGKLGRQSLPRYARNAHTAIVDRSAYAGFLRLLSHDGGSDDSARLRARIEELEVLMPKLGEYAPAIATLGADYLDLAGLAGANASYYERATRTLKRAFELNPAYPPARAKLASLLAKTGGSERAVELLREGLASHPHFAPYHETLGYVLRYAGLMKESMESYRRAQEIDGSLDNLVSTQDQITKSLIYLGAYDDALASHQRMRSLLEAAGRSPDEKQWFYEGVIHLYRGDTSSALAAFQAGARLLPRSIWTTFGRGYEAVALGDRERAGAVLEELERHEVVDGERHYRLVHFAAFAGRLDRALVHLETSTTGGFFNAPYIERDPWLRPLWSSVRFAQIVRAARARHDAVRRSFQASGSRHPPSE